MKIGNILAVILGVLVVIGGIWCLMTPLQTVMAMAWAMGVLMIIDGIANVATWAQLRKVGGANGWALASAIISIVFGVFVVTSFFLQFFLVGFFTFMVAGWLVVSGIMRIGFGWKMRKLNKQSQAMIIGSHWYVVFIMGILLLVLGIGSFFAPMLLADALGILTGISVIMLGVSVIALAV